MNKDKYRNGNKKKYQIDNNKDKHMRHNIKTIYKKIVRNIKKNKTKMIYNRNHMKD